jgi:hypothetical protein
MFHFQIATLHAKRLLLQSPVTPINTLCINSLTDSCFVVKIPFTDCPNIRFLLPKILFLFFQFTKFQNL